MSRPPPWPSQPATRSRRPSPNLDGTRSDDYVGIPAPTGGIEPADRAEVLCTWIPMTPDSTLTKVLCLVVLAVLAIAAGYAVVISLTNYSTIGV